MKFRNAVPSHKGMNQKIRSKNPMSKDGLKDSTSQVTFPQMVAIQVSHKRNGLAIHEGTNPRWTSSSSHLKSGSKSPFGWPAAVMPPQTSTAERSRKRNFSIIVVLSFDQPNQLSLEESCTKQASAPEIGVCQAVAKLVPSLAT